jgi:hypothetical protein
MHIRWRVYVKVYIAVVEAEDAIVTYLQSRFNEAVVEKSCCGVIEF